MSDDLETTPDPAGGPGGPNRLVKVLGIILLSFLVIYLLFTQVFPRVEGYLEDPTLGAPATAVAVASAEA